MKKQLLTLLTATLLFTSCSKKSDNLPEKPVAKLTELTAYFTPYKFGVPLTNSDFLWSTSFYDDNSNLISKSRRKGIDAFDNSKSYLETIYYKYDKNRMSEQKDDTYRYTYAYSGNDTLEVKQFGSTGLYQTKKYEYNQGILRNTKTYFNDGELFSVSNYSHNGNLIASIDILYKPFTVGNQLQYTYDNKGNVITESYLNREKNTNNIQKQFKYKYDENNRITEYTHSWGILSFRKWVRNYDTEGKLIKEDVYDSDKIDGPFNQRGTISYVYEFK